MIRASRVCVAVVVVVVVAVVVFRPQTRYCPSPQVVAGTLSSQLTTTAFSSEAHVRVVAVAASTRALLRCTDTTTGTQWHVGVALKAVAGPPPGSFTADTYAASCATMQNRRC
jgi:hypothetical protein